MKRFKIFTLSLVILAFALSGIHPAHASEGSITLHLARPDEGETYYAGPSSLQYSVQVNGSVQSSIYKPELLTIRLDLIQDHVQKDTYSVHPDRNGIFTFGVTVNPEGSVGNFTPVEIEGKCEDCHYQAELTFPPGPILLRVTASDPAGQQAVVERHLVVDLTSVATAPVTVVLDEDPSKPVPGVTISASSWMYLWRARHKSGLTGVDGTVVMSVEASSQSPLKYILQVEPSVVDGILYEGVEPASFTLQPGETSIPAITLRVRTKKGAIAGSVVGLPGSSSGGQTILAVHLPEGRVSRTQTLAGGKFVFPDLPIGKYLLLADPAELLPKGYSVKDQIVDLVQSNSVSAELRASELDGKTMHGIVRDEQGIPLPFAWAAVKGSSTAYPVDPRSGGFTIPEVALSAHTIIFSAPGYYSRAEAISSADPYGYFDVRLARRGENQSLLWGEGQVNLPPESLANVQSDSIHFEQGWLWGKGGRGQMVNIQAGEFKISVSSADFALEKLANQPAWLYVLKGEAAVQADPQAEPVRIGENQMVILYSGRTPEPVDLDPSITIALNKDHSRAVPEAWEPTLQARVRDGLARIGVSTAQAITGFGYLSLGIIIVLMPGAWLFRRLRASLIVKTNHSMIGDKHE